jgi:nucleotide-binding universal stress UspA family protein
MEGADMTKSILVPLDGSADAERALPTAAGLARQASLDVVLMTAEMGGVAVGPRHYLRRQAARFAIHDVGIRVVADLYPGPAIRSVVDTLDDPLVCMATRARNHLAPVLGNVTAEVLRGGAPVILLGPHGEAAPGEGGAVVDRILVPLEPASQTEVLVDVAAQWANRLSVPVILTEIVRHGVEADLDGARRHLGPPASRLREAGLEVQVEVERADGPAEAISCHAAGGTLVIMGTHNRTGWSRLRLGSVAMATVARAHGPVLLIGPGIPAPLHPDDAAVEESIGAEPSVPAGDGLPPRS